MQLIKTCIVEDLREIREGMISLLEQDERFEVLASYSNAETAAEELPAWQPHIVIMDINLPGMNGIECIRKVKSLCPATQFIMFTIYEDDEKVFEALMAGASGYLLKKTSLDKICDALVELSEGGSPMSTQIARKVINRLRNSEPSGVLEALSPRENEVLQFLAKGLLYKEIADKLSISPSTVRQHIHNIYDKLHVQNRAEAINKVYGRR
ncbi:MAG TPA: response regulator transcription factor [Chitinophagaceae bacterium]|nr:response regulator transcription factor [Chitinophagaceae bacterium]